MGVIYKSGHYYGKSPLLINDSVVSEKSTWSSKYIESLFSKVNGTKEMTLDEYIALSEDEQKNGTVYFITDKNNIYLNGISYGGGATTEEAGAVTITSTAANDGITDGTNYSFLQNGTLIKTIFIPDSNITSPEIEDALEELTSADEEASESDIDSWF